MTLSASIPISRIGDSYYLFDAPAISLARSEYRIPGLLTGTLPQASQQNVFLGLPLQLMPEEARLLVEKGGAYVIQDQQCHRQAIGELNGLQLAQWTTVLRDIGISVTAELDAKKQAEKQKAMGQMNEKAKRKKEKRMTNKEAKAGGQQNHSRPESQAAHSEEGVVEDVTLFETHASVPSQEHLDQQSGGSDARSATVSSRSSTAHATSEAHYLTPTVSYPPVESPSPSSSMLPATSRSYPLFKHLHDRDYFLSPGLRFGCQYMAYPGDPLRFHSHFMVIGRDWDEEVDLLSIVGAGRLGTGVKKGVLVGGSEPSDSEGAKSDEDPDTHEPDVRCFCIEWGGM